MMRLALTLMVVFVGCRAPHILFKGKQCSSRKPCPGALVCNGFTSTCEETTNCPYLDEVAPTCGGTDYYVAPLGDDSSVNAGLTLQTPRRTLTDVVLLPGDRVHLAPGQYAPLRLPDRNGSHGCPIRLIGSGREGTILSQELDIAGSYWSIESLTLRPGAAGGYWGIAAISREEVVIRDVLVTEFVDGSTDHQAIVLDACKNCRLLSSTVYVHAFGVYLGLDSSGSIIFGNTFSVRDAQYAIAVFSEAVIEGNDFSGTVQKEVIGTWQDHLRLVVHRNVFHDLSGGGALLRTPDADITNNSFVKIGSQIGAITAGPLLSSPSSPATITGNISNNLFYQAELAIERDVPSSGQYNLFDQVGYPYQGGRTPSDIGPADKIGRAMLGSDNAPLLGSDAIDSGNPNSPVPAGGGTRIDIGAFELGAPRLPDGRYCVQGMTKF